MNKILLSLLALGTGFVSAAPLPPADLLAKNEVLAEFVGLKDMPCHFRTALCPDQCGHATSLAQFKVIENCSYEKSGEYGDDKAEAGSILHVDVKKDIEGQDAAIVKTIKDMKAGDKVKLTITHYYVNKDGNRYPVRPATQLEIQK